MKSEATSDPRIHQENIIRELEELIRHARADVERVSDPRLQVLLETAAEVLTGLKTAFQNNRE